MGIVRHFERLGLGGNERHFGLWPAAGLFWRRLLTDGSLAAAEDAALDAVDNEEEEAHHSAGKPWGRQTCKAVEDALHATARRVEGVGGLLRFTQLELSRIERLLQ